MTSVNSPASLLARNYFYRSFLSSPEEMNSTSQQNNSALKQLLLWVSLGLPPGLPVAIDVKGLLMEVALGSSSPPGSKPPDPEDQHVK